MGTMKELSAILEEMIAVGNNLIQAADALRQYYTAEPAPVPEPDPDPAEAPVEEQKKALTKEDVRKILVQKSNLDNGLYKPEVKALVRKFSASGNLSSVDPSDYEALAAELEMIGNG